MTMNIHLKFFYVIQFRLKFFFPSIFEKKIMHKHEHKMYCSWRLMKRKPGVYFKKTKITMFSPDFIYKWKKFNWKQGKRRKCHKLNIIAARGALIFFFGNCEGKMGKSLEGCNVLNIDCIIKETDRLGFCKSRRRKSKWVTLKNGGKV